VPGVFERQRAFFTKGILNIRVLLSRSSVYCSTVLCCVLAAFSASWAPTQSLLGWGISPSQGHYIHTGQHRHRINARRHPYLKWNSNPRSPVFERAKTVHALDRAATVTFIAHENMLCTLISFPWSLRFFQHSSHVHILYHSTLYDLCRWNGVINPESVSSTRLRFRIFFCSPTHISCVLLQPTLTDTILILSHFLYNRPTDDGEAVSPKARPHYTCSCSPGLCSSGDSFGFYLCS
jgi:hypothetical protein